MAVSQGLIEIAQSAFCERFPLASSGKIVGAPFIRFIRRVEHLCEQRTQPLRGEDMLLKRCNHDIVQTLPPDVRAVATFCASVGFLVADIVIVVPTLSGADSHSFIANAAFGDLGKQGRTVGDAGRSDRGSARCAQGSHCVHNFGRDDLRAFDANPVLFGCWRARLVARHVEIVTAVMASAKNAGDIGIVEFAAFGESIAAVVQPFGNRTCAHGACTITGGCKLEYLPHDIGMLFLNEELLFGLRSAHLDGSTFITERHGSAVEELLLCVAPHGSPGVLAGFDRKILVERGDKVAQHVAHCVIRKILGQRDKAHLCTFEPREGLHLRLHAPPQARQRENLDFADAVSGIFNKVDQAVELGSPGVLPALACIYEDANKSLPLRLRIGANQFLLTVD